MYCELPPGIKDQPQFTGKILELHWSIYGHKFVAKLFYELVQDALTKKLPANEQFKVSVNDHCLFLQQDCAIVTWIDDAIFIHKDPKVADKLIQRLRDVGMDLEKEKETGTLKSYLGVDMIKQSDGSMKLYQIGLINCIIDAMGLQNAAPKDTPVTEVIG
jgi:hypothetical protein